MFYRYWYCGLHQQESVCSISLLYLQDLLPLLPICCTLSALLSHCLTTGHVCWFKTRHSIGSLSWVDQGRVDCTHRRHEGAVGRFVVILNSCVHRYILNIDISLRLTSLYFTSLHHGAERRHRTGGISRCKNAVHCNCLQVSEVYGDISLLSPWLLSTRTRTRKYSRWCDRWRWRVDCHFDERYLEQLLNSVTVVFRSPPWTKKTQRQRAMPEIFLEAKRKHTDTVT